jgi:LPS-assembly protein
LSGTFSTFTTVFTGLHGKFLERSALYFLCAISLALNISGQALPSAPPPEQRPKLGPNDVEIDSAGTQEQIGPIKTAEDSVVVYTGSVYATGDKVSFDRDSNHLQVQGNVFYQNLEDGQKLKCDLVEYNVETKTGTFYNVSGSANAVIEAKPGLLTTSNPFYFEGKTAEKMEKRYIVHDGFITDCKPSNAWWKLKGSKFDIIPDDRAIAHHATLYLKGIPIFYFPTFYKSLKPQPRRSGFLTPSFGNSSQRGQFFGIGYFLALGRSYDITYRTTYFTQRGFVHQGDFSGWINSRTNFDATIFGAGEYKNGSTDRPSGYVATGNAKTFFGNGWEGRAEVRLLSSLNFRQEFTQSFDEAIGSETHALGFLAKHWGDYGFNISAQRNVNYQSSTPGDQILIRKLPETQFVMREHALGKLPIWVSFDSSAGLDSRTQPSCQLATVPKCPNPDFATAFFMPRLDFTPRVTSAAHWFGLDLSPSFTIHETYYGQSLMNGQAVDQSLVRFARDFQFDLGLPRLSRVFVPPKWFRAGDKVKHVIEARIRYRYVTGIDDFRQTLRFDQLDVISNTNEVEFSLKNRLLKRNGAGGTDSFLSWELYYKRFFDPTFGGAIIANHRNVFETSDLLTGYAFLYGPRRQSPIVSIFRTQTKFSVEWRTDYDPVLKKFVNSTLGVGVNLGRLQVSASNNRLDTNPVLAPKANQVRGSIQYGDNTRRGWNYGFTTGYDYLLGSFQFLFAQATYNTDCCGFSVQYRKNNFTAINDNQFRFAFTIANVGSFGTLQRQQRIIY